MKVFFRKYRQYVWAAAYAVLTLLAFILGFEPGQAVFALFADSLVEMAAFVPFVFIMVGLLDVWMPKTKIQAVLGSGSGVRGIGLVVLLAMLQAGPLYGAFPVAYLLYRKGASLRNIFIYLGAFSSFKIPMLGIEIGYLGVEFSLIRTLVSLPLFIGIGFLMERYLKDKDYEILDGGAGPAPGAPPSRQGVG
jgi:uncharacterized membrane protein YraQ (UPF0718 family)